MKEVVLHPLNLVMIAALGASAVLTGSWIPLAIGAGAELAWVALGRVLPSQRAFRAYRRGAAATAARKKGEQEILRTLDDEDRRRFLELDRLRRDIEKLVRDNPSLTTEMLSAEIPKIDHLVGGFLRVASTASRYEEFVKGSDLNELEEDVRRQEKIVEKTQDGDARSVAAQNLELMQRRLERAAEMRRQVRDARGQLLLIENTIRLLRDQIVTMQSPEELSHRLDDLVRTVDAIETTGKETEAITRHLDDALQQQA